MARPDPRVDPASVPPTEAAKTSIEKVAVSNITAPSRSSDKLEVESGVVAVEPPKVVTSADPRVAEIEPLVALNDWRAVAEKLGTIEDAGKLPPNLGLVAAVAHNEAAKDGDQAARELAIRCVGGVLGMSSDGEIVRVIARRLLRKNVRLHERPAPPPKTSALIIVVVLAAAAGLGWFLSSGTFSRLIGR